MNRYFIDESKKKSAVSILFVLLVALFSFFIGSALAMSGGAEDTSVANAYITSGTAITNEAGFKAIRNKSTNAYLANDIILTNTTGYDSSKANATPFSGILYGNGKTITINMGYQLSAISDASTHYIGLLFAYLQGTVQDCNIVLNGNVCFYETVGSGDSYITNFFIAHFIFQGSNLNRTM